MTSCEDRRPDLKAGSDGNRAIRFFHRARAAGVVVAFVLTLGGCDRPTPDRSQGYIEGEFLYISAPLPGTLEALSVSRGAQVKSGDLLFVLESAVEAAALAEAGERLAQARATLEDTRKGRRPPEIESIEAQLKHALAARELAEKELTRQELLARTKGATTAQDVDRARSAAEQARARVEQFEAELAVARLGARTDQVAAAEANVRAMEAAVSKGKWDLSQKRQNAPESGVVFDTLYREGEWVAAGRPVVVLLPPANIKLRTFVPEPWLSSIHVGDPVQVFIDGTRDPVSARVRFVAPRAEFTPPVIYSREQRNKFVFLIEAEFDPPVAQSLHPGQPVDVRFTRPAADER